MIDEGITLKKLQIFMYFMQTGTLKGAADKLGISIVSVHKALHSLEDALRCPLFEHQGRSLRPLNSATTLYSHCEKLLKHLNFAIKDTQDIAGVGSTHLMLGSLYSLTFELVPAIISGLRRRKPDLKITLTQGSNESLLKQLDKLELDVILISLSDQAHMQGYTIMPIYTDEMMLAIRKNSHFYQCQEIDLSDLTSERLLTLTKGFATQQDCLNCFHNADIEPEVSMQVGDIFTLMNMIQSGIGYSLVPSRLKNKYSDNIDFIKIKNGCAAEQSISMVCLESKERDPVILSCIAECRLYALVHDGNLNKKN